MAVVAGQLHGEAVRAQLQPALDHVAVDARVLDPTRGVGREIGVLAEDVVGADVLLQLHQEALVANERVQWIVRLHLVELRGGQKALAQRRHAEIDEGVPDRGLAEPAARLALAGRRSYLVHCDRRDAILHVYVPPIFRRAAPLDRQAPPTTGWQAAALGLVSNRFTFLKACRTIARFAQGGIGKRRIE